jgi:hypothetical protein
LSTATGVLGPLDFDQPAVLAEVRAAFERYEAALISNDVELLNNLFLQSDNAVRFGLAEQHYGIEAIAAYRRAAARIDPGRRLLRTVISSFGTNVACVACEFVDPSSSQLGRQSQTWVRTAAGWRIAAAHVSLSNAQR